MIAFNPLLTGRLRTTPCLVRKKSATFSARAVIAASMAARVLVIGRFCAVCVILVRVVDGTNGSLELRIDFIANASRMRLASRLFGPGQSLLLCLAGASSEEVSFGRFNYSTITVLPAHLRRNRIRQPSTANSADSPVWKRRTAPWS
jgi:hypothetical protein